jgi:NADH-quinone oxidoreductase subunit N
VGSMLSTLIPEMILVAVATVLYLAAGFRRPDSSGRLWALWAVLACAAALVVACLASPDKAPQLGQAVLGDALALFAKVIFPLAGIGFILISWPQADNRTAPEYYATLLVSLAGMMLVGSAGDMVSLFLGLEMVSIPTYLLIYLMRPGRLSKEAAAKYFFLGIFAGGLFLYGLSLLYGLTGQMNLAGLREGLVGLDAKMGPVVLLAVVMVVAGLSYKIAAVPMHFYVPDVYQGAPTSVTALLAFGPKAAGFLALVRLVTHAMDPVAGETVGLLWLLAVITMTTGNVLGLLQSNVKRMLAYSSIAHAGYMLMGLVVGHRGVDRIESPGVFDLNGVASVLFYLVGYAVVNLGAFAVLTALQRKGAPAETLEEVSGLSKRNPLMAAMMAIFMFSLMGMPLTVGFIGKLCLFSSVLAAKPLVVNYNYLLAAIAAINAAIAGFYYLRVCARMYLHEPVHEVTVSRALPLRVTILACTVLTLVLGILPGWVLEKVRIAAEPPTIRVQQQITPAPGQPLVSLDPITK